MSEVFTNPAVAEALARAEDQSGLKDHINEQIETLGKAIQQDTLDFRSTMYARKSFTIGALVAYDAEVRRLVSRAGVNLRVFDENIAIATQAVVEEMNRSNPIGKKLHKVLMELYQNGNYR